MTAPLVAPDQTMGTDPGDPMPEPSFATIPHVFDRTSLTDISPNQVVPFTGLNDLFPTLDSTITPLDNPFGGTRMEPNTIPGVPGATVDGKGMAASALRTAMTMLGTPYVWGGSGASGVDCSGLIYYALKSAGFDVPRYRAKDWGHMGQAVSVQDARPGDVVYYDEPGDTDHVGLYIGNGMMIQAPETGDVVKISSIGHATSIRRVLPDTAWQDMTTDPAGRWVWQHAGMTLRGGG